MKYALGIAALLLLALIAVQFKLQNLAVQRAAPLPSVSLNVLPNSKASARFVVPQGSIYDVALVIDRNKKNFVGECDFALNVRNSCPKKPSIINLDLELLENNQRVKQVFIRGDNRILWWGNTLGSHLIGFKGKKENHYEVIVQNHSSLEKLKELNPRVQVSLTSRQAKGAFAAASMFSIIALLLIAGIFVCLLVAIVLFYKKKAQK